MSSENKKQGGPAAGRPMRRGHGHMGAMMPGEKARDFKGSMSKLIGYLGSHRWTILLVSILAAASTAFTILGPRILGQATDELFSGMMRQISGAGGIDFGKIGGILLWLLGLYALSALFSYLQGYLLAGVTARVTLKLRNELGAKIHRLPLGYYDRTTHGDILSRITNDVDTISQTLNQSLTQIITAAISLVGITAMMLMISWQLTLAALGIIPLTVAAVFFIVRKSQVHFKDQQNFLGSVNGHVEEMLGNHELVKAFSGEEGSLETFDRYNGQLYKAAWKSNFLSGLMMPATLFIGNLAYVVICILGGYYAVAGVLTVGGIQAFIQYVRSFTQPITQVANIANVLQQTAAAAERVFEFLEEPEESTDAEPVLHRAGSRPPAAGRIAFERVSFSYEPGEAVIKNFSAAVEPGQKIAIVGPTGAGKTTIVKLLMRFYDLESGAITIDGENIRQLERNELRSLFGMVLQDTWLFNGTIADNIRYGNLAATDEEVRRAAVVAQADHFVRTLPGGYNMVLNEEADNISQGQKQLLTIARAILADPEILILDEATSNVDTRTESLIQKAMDNLMRGRTSFVIAHRLSTIRNADLILVMEEGGIAEQGTHDGLLAQKGIYADLYNSQFEKAGGF